MAQPNIRNFNAAIAGISQAASDITLKVQDFNTHQQALGDELLLFGNAPVAQIQQQLTDILAAINQSNLLNSARYTSRPTYPILQTDLCRDWNINAKMENSRIYQQEGLFIALHSVNIAPNAPTTLNQPIPSFPDTPADLDQLSS
jgi:hypothetical protein